MALTQPQAALQCNLWGATDCGSSSLVSADSGISHSEYCACQPYRNGHVSHTGLDKSALQGWIISTKALKCNQSLRLDMHRQHETQYAAVKLQLEWHYCSGSAQKCRGSQQIEFRSYQSLQRQMCLCGPVYSFLNTAVHACLIGVTRQRVTTLRKMSCMNNERIVMHTDTEDTQQS